jgi:hypothetical protein
MSIFCGMALLNRFVDGYGNCGESACTTRASGLVTQFLTRFAFEPGSTSSLTSEETFWLAEEIFADEAGALSAPSHAVSIAY